MKSSIKHVFEPEVIIKNNIIRGKRKVTFTMEDVNSFFSRTKKSKKQKEMVWEALQVAREKRLLKKNRAGKYVLLSQMVTTSARRKLPGKSRRLVKRLEAKKKKGGYSMTGLLAYLGLKWQARQKRKSARRSSRRRQTRRRTRS